MTTPISHRRLVPSTSLWISSALASLILYSNATAQQLSGMSNITATAASGILQEVNRSPHSRLMQRTTTLTNAAGVAITRTNSYMELATGMNVLSNGVYVAASPQIQVTPFGGAATNCQTPVAFAANLNTSDAIDLTTPDGLHMTTDIAALAYYDGTTNVFFAVPQDSIGQLLPSLNQVLYTNAFTNTSCDVLYTLTRAGFEQNVIIRRQLPSPASLGLNPNSKVWLQVWTEFASAPVPQISETVSNGDQTLTFGQMMSMRKGKAFLLGTNAASVPTVKQWFTSEGRTFLIESVLLNALAPQLNQLPGGLGPTGGSSGGEQSRVRPPHPLLASAVAPRQKPIQLPAKKLAIKKSGTMGLAGTLPAQKGVVVDYNLSGTVPSFTFQSDTTYFIIDAVNIMGAATYEGGTVIKFTNSPTAGIAAGSVVWNTSMYRPAIFTGKDDNTVGTTVSGSTGNPTTNFYGNIALDLSEISSPIVSNARFLFLSNVFLGDYITLRDVQAVNCDAVFNYQGFFYTLENVLLANDNVVSDANAELEGFSGNSVTCQNVTADNCGSFEVDPTSATIFTNCILTHVGNWRCGVTYTNNSVFLSNSSGIFQTAGAGNYYLADGSTNHYAGTTNIDATLLADLRQKTTYPPLWLTNNFTANANIFPQAPRETNSLPDIGYAYDPVDYLVGCTVSNATLTITNGAVLGYYNYKGIYLMDGSQLISQGTPTNRNYFVHYRLVQEQATNLFSSSLYGTASVSFESVSDNYPSATLRYLPDQP